MNLFEDFKPSTESYWRSIILFGRNVASYKFALGQFFCTAALFRMPVFPEDSIILFTFGIPNLIAVACLIWFTIKHRRLNKVFAAAVLLLIAAVPLRPIIGDSAIWLNFVDWLAT